jgi:hypothetical protein
MVKQEQQKGPIKAGRNLQSKIVNRWKHKMVENELDIEKEWKNLQHMLKSAENESLWTIKRRNRRKYIKNGMTK